MCRGLPAADGLWRFCRDSGFTRRDVRGHAGHAAAAAELQQPLHQRNEVKMSLSLKNEKGIVLKFLNPGTGD